MDMENRFFSKFRGCPEKANISAGFSASSYPGDGEAIFCAGNFSKLCNTMLLFFFVSFILVFFFTCAVFVLCFENINVAPKNKLSLSTRSLLYTYGDDTVPNGSREKVSPCKHAHMLRGKGRKGSQITLSTHSFYF